MRPLHRVKVAAFKARLQMCEAERRRIVETATKSQVSLAQIAERIELVENDIRVLTNELKLLEISALEG
jgi:hypothetical protein